jgi:hypothetical protein
MGSLNLVSPKNFKSDLRGYKAYLKALGIEYKPGVYFQFALTFTEFKAINRRTDAEILQEEIDRTSLALDNLYEDRKRAASKNNLDLVNIIDNEIDFRAKQFLRLVRSKHGTN